jgi:hypothetical protein
VLARARVRRSSDPTHRRRSSAFVSLLRRLSSAVAPRATSRRARRFSRILAIVVVVVRALEIASSSGFARRHALDRSSDVRFIVERARATSDAPCARARARA